MMYSNKLAVAIKSAGKVLREFKDEVYVPFGSEYSIFIKNMNSVRALVTVEIDGQDVGDGTRFIVNANDSIELERFIKNGNFNQGNRFKFIERTGSVERHRGVGIEDGLVRVSFNFEQVQQPIKLGSPWVHPYKRYAWEDYPQWRGNDLTWITCSGGGDGFKSTSGAFYNANIGSASGEARGIAPQNSVTANYVGSIQPDVSANVENDVGVTVPGSISDQRFYTAAWFPTEATTHVIVLKMLGQTKDNVQVVKPVTVKQKPVCTSCGRTNKANAKFCTECGTSLQIV